MSRERTVELRRWRNAWVALACAAALHVADEALSGFLPVYNEVIRGIRQRYGWAPFPTFTFAAWLIGLTLGIALLFALTPLVAVGKRGLRAMSLVLAVIMAGNALGHIVASIYWRTLAPGVYSSPLLLVAAVALFAFAKRVTSSQRPRGSID